MGWTSEQKNAINARNSSVVVSAAAGSGKTAVLTERIIELIRNPETAVSADKMIIVTFGNDATAELRKRLDTKLYNLISNTSDNEVLSHLMKQQILLQNAKISTINSFCFELIRDNLTEQGITSGFSIIDDTEDNIIKSHAMEDLIEYYSEYDPEKLSVVYDNFCKKDMRSLTDVINQTDNFLTSVSFREKWLDKAVEMYRKPFTESVYYGQFMKKSIENLTVAYRLVTECYGLIDKMFKGDRKVSVYDKTEVLIEKEIRQIKDYLEIFKAGNIPDNEITEKTACFDSLNKIAVRSQKDKAKCDMVIRDEFVTKRKKYIELTKEITEMCESPEQDYRLSAKITEILAEMMKKYYSLIWERKCVKNALTFHDGERLALEILSETDGDGNIIQSEIAEKISEFYDIIMIDEYQDSNNKQDLIFKLISKNYRHDENGDTLYGDNVFLVGDVKQSIYGFRLANPENFVSTLKHSEPYSENSKAPNKKIFLNQNFRSSPEVIDFVNYVFSNIMSEKCGDIEYTDDERLNFDPEINFGEHDDSRLTHISFINTEVKKDEKKSGTKRKKKEKSNTEAIFTANKIASMLRNGYEVSEQGIKRPCRPSDFCILVRNNDYINVYAKEIEKLGIPVRTHEDKGYLESREIAVLLDVLRVINNPLTDISVMAVLTSPMYMFSHGEMAFIKSLDTEKPLFVIISGIVRGDYAECAPALQERCRDFTESIEKLRLDSVTMTIGELIGRIYDTTDFISVMQLYSDGDKKRANLRLLIQYAKKYESSSSYEGTGGLSGFLRHIDKVKKNGGYKTEKTAVSSGDYVSVMTLHKSKGLEFTFVFMVENNIAFRYDNDTVLCSPDGRAGYNLYDRRRMKKHNTFQRIMLYNERKNGTRSEEMRLMYVGLTRAKQQLFINIGYNETVLKSLKDLINDYKSCDGDLKNMSVSAKKFSDWMWLCIMNHVDFRKIADRLCIDAPVAKSSDKIFEYEFCDNPEEQKAEEIQELPEIMPDENICKRIYRIINNSYDDSLSRIPAKLSVTQITRKYKEEENFDFKLKRPKFVSERDVLTGAERGTAIHTFFQYCNFESAGKNPENEINRLVSMGYISTGQAECINPDKVRAFLESSLYERAIKSYQIWREKKFTVAVSELKLEDGLMEKFRNTDNMIKGIVDLMFEESDGIVIVDYKSDRHTTTEKLAERYTMQMKLYKSAVELTTGKNVKEIYLYSIELEKAVKII
ncbi:MAG: UvrD-helicase domain-containing protein [Ruminococcus sp.]|nr:UvrD-helicase domain-containing protein [Ruminococcus sp.]